MSHRPRLSRRAFLAGLSAAPALMESTPGDSARAVRAGGAMKPKVCIFSKHLHWTGWEEMAAIAADVGFDGVDLTVRQGGHVLPERVEDDLPRVAEIVRRAGLELPMMTTDIADVQSPHAEAILKTAHALGIHYYRWGGFTYDYTKSIADQLEERRPQVKDLVALNKQYDICAMYHTHSGLGLLGASIWDLWYLLKDFDTKFAGVNFDIGHATVEGGLGGWVNSLHLTLSMIRGVAVKDFAWGKDKNNRWEPQWCPPGQGMVNFPQFFQTLKASGFSGPIQLHFEYPGLGGANDGDKTLTIEKKTLIAVLRRDLGYLRGVLRAIEWS